MNAFMTIKRALIGVGVLGLIGAAVLLAPGGIAQASVNPQAATPPAPQTQPQTPTQTGPERQTARLERLFAREQTWLGTQAKRLGRVETLTARIQNLIDRLKAKGIDVSPLEAALKDFQASIPAARAAHASAGQILEAHLGFNPAGKVTDLAEARQTILTAGQNLKEARRIMNQAFADLIRVGRQFRQQGKTASVSQ